MSRFRVSGPTKARHYMAFSGLLWLARWIRRTDAADKWPRQEARRGP